MDFYSFYQNQEADQILAGLHDQNEVILSGVGNITTKALLIVQFLQKQKKGVIYVMNNDTKDKELIDSLSFWVQKRDYNFFFLDLEIRSEELSHESQYKILDFLYKLNKFKGIFVIKKEHLDKIFPDKKEIVKRSIDVTVGSDFRSVEIFNNLIQQGYVIGQDLILKKGEYRRSGGILDIFPLDSDIPYKIEIEFDKVVNIWSYDQENKQIGDTMSEIIIPPVIFDNCSQTIYEVVQKNCLYILDEFDEYQLQETIAKYPHIIFTSFPQTEQNYQHLRYLSVLKFYNLTDFLNDLREKISRKWKVAIYSRRFTEIKNIFLEDKIPYVEGLSEKKNVVHLVDGENKTIFPVSFQNPVKNFELITDKEIFSLKRGYKNKTLKKISLEFLSSLKPGDFVAHFDHGVGRFLGIIQRKIDNISREYLEIIYAENDRLFVPIDQADKITKYVSAEEAEDNEPRLSRLGSQEWKNITKKVKKETEKIAKELLKLYAERAQAKGHTYNEDNKEQQKFEALFPYEETPGQLKAIQDFKQDMESDKPMDRLICGDVGFGKTEVAMRAAFKAVQNKKQVVFISPITILADQHFRSFTKRAKGFNIRIEMLSRFRTVAQQRKIIKDLSLGKIDVVIGTHRLLQPDVKFFNLGMVIIDEEQRFGVKQKEALKQLRSSIDILTLTATPIPRTLNMSLNKLRDITIITTPPPGRLPVITEVRKYGDLLIRESILREIQRKGQVYFLHNKVETIEGIAQKLRYLVPEAKFVVAHGQLNSGDLENRIVQFKKYKYDVLVSSTIIENGIDLANANTLIVNNAENFGLSQLYQLRGRVGRGKVQAYAFFLYHTQKLKDDAKKRLKAIVEASELGAGFQIAMRDLEIRGAGEILGANQHGMMNIVGVGHFIRLLNQTIEEIKKGGKMKQLKTESETVIELPIEAYIPNTYISDQKEKISVYQRLSAVDKPDLLQELMYDLREEYGELPKQVGSLFKILDIKLEARKAGITHIKNELQTDQTPQVVLYLSEKVTAKNVMGAITYNSKWRISGNLMKISIKNLGFNWLEALKENISKMI